MEGWISLYRKFAEWEWYTDSTVKSVFLHLLLFANYEDKRLNGLLIKKGQRLTSVRRLSEELNIYPNGIVRALKILEKSGCIKYKTDHKFGTLVTIVKYSDYQCINSVSVSNIDTLTDTPSDTPIVTLTDTPIDTLTDTKQQENNDNNIINNNITNACARTREENSDVENSELQQYSEKLKADVPRCEKECMENHLANLDTLNCYIDKFNTELYLSGRAPHCFSDYRSHFHNWLRIQVDRETKEVNNLKSSEYGTNKQNNRKSNDRPEGWLEAAVEWGIATAKQQRAELAERNR